MQNETLTNVRMLREHHVTGGLISSEGSHVQPLCGMYLISESVLCSSNSEYTKVKHAIAMPCLSIIPASSMFSGLELGL